jgi:hypothetical protein
MSVPVAILLRDVATQAIVATTTTTVADELSAIASTSVPPGTYEILATTDRDGDGALCDCRESCGAYPTRRDPSIVTVVGGTTIRARDFALDSS